MTTKRKALLGFAAASPLFLFILWGYCHLECYCVFYPGIDTRYASGFSESAFSLVTTGMTAEAVQQKLGAPLHTDTNRDGTIRWYYTDDGKCIVGDWKLADFAWLGREVAFRDDRVVQVYKHVHED
jgi:outer membrane protein assembly factor BamE (lipoprotein component of BamABCDE complex)